MPRTPPRTAAATVLEIFHRILRDRGATPVALLAADLALPRSTLHRFVTTLEAAGFVARCTPGHYDIALAFAAAAQGLSAHAKLAQASRPVLAALAGSCHATAHLGVLESDMVTYLVKVSATTVDPADIFTRENAQLEAYCSGIGKVLLALLPAADRVRYLSSGPFVPLTRNTIVKPGRLATTLAVVRRDGFATDDGEIKENLYCLAVPLWSKPRKLQAAISLSFSRVTNPQAGQVKYLAKLRRAAGEIARALGADVD